MQGAVCEGVLCVPQDSKKLLTFGKQMTNYDGTKSNLDPTQALPTPLTD